MSGPVTLESDLVRLVVLADVGGKIASLQHLPSGREWLLAPPRRWPARPARGSRFTDVPLWGWDEIVPTIEPSRGLPDHGEAWTLPWHAERFGGALRCAVAGRALPYRLARTVAVDDAVVTLDYELTASSPVRLLWAAHPQFVLDPAGTRVIVPDGVEALVDVTADQRVDVSALADPLGALAPGAGRKLYVEPEIAIDRIALQDGRGPWLIMRWDAARLPYLGAWIDHGAFAPRPVVVIEPTTGYYDSLERAERLGRIAEVAPGSPLRWWLALELGTTEA